MTTTRRVLLVQQHMDGRPEMTTLGVAVLFGTTLTELGKWVDLDGDASAAEKLPAWLIQQGRRRTREAEAAAGGSTVTEVLTHWAIRDFCDGVLGFDFATTEDVHRLWMIATPEIADRIAGEAGAT